jgi:hypothetical protein
MLDEISLIDNQMFSFIDKRLQIIKHIRNNVFGILDVWIIGDFRQMPQVHDSFKYFN